MEAIETIRIETDAASAVFDSMAGYKHLTLHYSAASNTTSGDTKSIFMYFNDVSSADYEFFQMYGRATSGSGFQSSSSNTRTGFLTTRQKSVGYMGGAPAQYGCGTVLIPDYLHANKNIVCQQLGGKSLTADGRGQTSMTTGILDSATALTKITLLPETGSWLRGTVFTLYGLKSS
jgi:hypothetical protein